MGDYSYKDKWKEKFIQIELFILIFISTIICHLYCCISSVLWGNPLELFSRTCCMSSPYQIIVVTLILPHEYIFWILLIIELNTIIGYDFQRLLICKLRSIKVFLIIYFLWTSAHVSIKYRCFSCKVKKSSKVCNFI